MGEEWGTSRERVRKARRERIGGGRPQADRATPSVEASDQSALELTLAPIGATGSSPTSGNGRPLVVPRGEPGRFDGLMSPADAERLVCQTGIRVPGMRLVKEGAQLPLGGYAEDIPWRPGALRQRDGRASGGRVRGRRHDRPSGPATQLARCCRSTAAGSSGTRLPGAGQRILDAGDVPGLRGPSRHPRRVRPPGRGAKRWRIYEPVLELPLKHQRWSARARRPGLAD